MARVLVVEDEDVLLEMLATLVQEMGHESLTAADGQEALEFLQQKQNLPNLIIADIMMPRLNGISLAHHVRNDPYLQKIPIILMSAAAKPTNDQLYDYFLHKPFNVDLLIDLIQQYIMS